MSFLQLVSSSLLLRQTNQQRSLLMGALGYLGVGLVGYGFVNLLRGYWRWMCSPLRTLPGPKNASFFLGVFRQIQKEPFLAPHKAWFEQAGPDAKLIHYTTVLGRSSLLVVDKDLVRTILTAPAGKAKPRFAKRMDFIASVIGAGLVVLEGEDWMRHRRILQPAFNTAWIRSTLNQVVPNKVNELITYWNMASSSREIDAYSHLSALTLDIIGPAAFSHDFKGLERIREWASDACQQDVPALDDPFMKAISSAFKMDPFSVVFILLNSPSLDKMRSKKRLARKLLNDETDKIVANAAATDNKKNNPENNRSILSTLLDAQQQHQQQLPGVGKLSLEEIRDEVKTFVLAGHETTSTWCYWAMYALAKYPSIQERVHDDVIQHAPRSSVESITLDQTDEMEYLFAFMQEVLRLYPPAGFSFRYNTHAEILGDVKVPPNTRLAISPHILHRHPKYWDNPEEFSPERWINVTHDQAEQRRFAFIPFSSGGRNCIGQRFATMEACMIVAALVRAFRIEVAPSQKDVEHTFTSSITMKAKPGLHIVVNKR